MARINIIVSCVFSLFAIAVIVGSSWIPVSADLPLTQGSPDFPRILSIGIMILSAILFAMNIGAYRSERKEDRARVFQPEQVRIVAGGFGIILAGAILMAVVGFIPSMIALNFAFLAYFKVKSKRLTFSVSIVAPLAVYVVFEIALNIPLPGGLLFP